MSIYNFFPGNSYGLFFITELMWTRYTENEIDIYLKFGERKILMQFNAVTKKYK